ncbi:MAG: hypothetical protein ACR2HQ_03805 [Ilumatobacteraceae bacterium]
MTVVPAACVAGTTAGDTTDVIVGDVGVVEPVGVIGLLGIVVEVEVLVGEVVGVVGVVVVVEVVSTVCAVALRVLDGAATVGSRLVVGSVSTPVVTSGLDDVPLEQARVATATAAASSPTRLTAGSTADGSSRRSPRPA